MRLKLSRFVLYVLLAALAVGGPASSVALAQGGDRSGGDPTGGGGGGGGGFTHLEPGKLSRLNERVPVNYVFVGYEPEDVNQSAFLQRLPRVYRPVVSSRLFYGRLQYLGLNYTYQNNVVFTTSAYERQVFGFLSQQARPAPLTLFQELYNEQANNAQTIRRNHFIDAPTVEEYLAKNPPAGVNTGRNTVYFINWWGNKPVARAGFKHHVYTKTDEADPDTNYNFGRERESRKIIAWGGTPPTDEESGYGLTKRVWFYDLSAGPDAFTGNYDVDNADADGDGEADYRIPPVWEYFTPGGFRAKSALTGDLARVSRFVAVNLLFTSSPIYPPQFTPQLLPRAINLDLNTYEGIPGTNASVAYQSQGFLLDEVREVHRLPYTLDDQDLPYDAKARECYTKFRDFVYGLLAEPAARCYPTRTNYTANSNLFLNNALKLGAIRDDEAADRVYEAPLINYAVTDDGPDTDGDGFGDLSPPFLGFADDNQRNGTQSFIFNFVSPFIAAIGYGLSTTQVHEYGHHLNLNHPFNGYDYELGLQFQQDNNPATSPADAFYGPSGEFFYVSAGNENNTIMSYVDLNWDFSQWDKDNTNRFQASAYINNANAIAARVLNSGNASAGIADLRTADRYYGAAKSALAAHNYNSTFDNARLTYEFVLVGARKAGVRVTESNDAFQVVSGRAVTTRIPGYAIDKPERARRQQTTGPSIQQSRGGRYVHTPSGNRNLP